MLCIPVSYIRGCTLKSPVVERYKISGIPFKCTQMPDRCIKIEVGKSLSDKRRKRALKALRDAPYVKTAHLKGKSKLICWLNRSVSRISLLKPIADAIKSSSKNSRSKKKQSRVQSIPASKIVHSKKRQRRTRLTPQGRLAPAFH